MKMFRLSSEAEVRGLWDFLKANVKAAITAGRPLEVEVFLSEKPVTLRMRKRYWAILRFISENGWKDGRQYSAVAWHEFFKQEFIGVVDIPGGKTIGISTTKLNRDEFQDYVLRIEVYAGEDLQLDFQGGV